MNNCKPSFAHPCVYFTEVAKKKWFIDYETTAFLDIYIKMFLFYELKQPCEQV